MADVVHRTTVQYLRSVHTPDYPIGTWIHDPDLSALSGVPQEHWKVVGDTVVEMNATEKEAVDFPAAVANKISAVDSRTSELIDDGFEYPASSGVYFSLSATAQSTLLQLDALRDEVSFSYPVKCNSKDNGAAYSLANSAAVLAFFLEAFDTLRGHLDSGTALKDSVRAATTAALANAVVDSR